ncbi:MAG: flagellar export chaperone FliS [Planctomycetes bacterium]|jgi:flagellar protein FliS|nr:flagellar export chaperone FliS [Planctomycetota bacterium]
MADQQPARAAAGAYRRAEINTLSQRDLLVRLYQGAERFLTHARNAMAKGEIETAHGACQKTKAIFTELVATLDLEKGGDVARQLKELYLFLILRTVEANLRKDPAIIDQLLPIIATLRGAWEQIPDSEANTSARVGGEGHFHIKA